MRKRVWKYLVLRGTNSLHQLHNRDCTWHCKTDKFNFIIFKRFHIVLLWVNRSDRCRPCPSLATLALGLAHVCTSPTFSKLPTIFECFHEPRTVDGQPVNWLTGQPLFFITSNQMFYPTQIFQSHPRLKHNVGIRNKLYNFIHRSYFSHPFFSFCSLS